MRKLTKLASVFCAAAMTAVLGFTSLADNSRTNQAQETVTGPVMYEGTVVSMENGCLTINRKLGEGYEDLVVMISEETKLLDGVYGLPIPGENLEKGETVHVYAGPAMTMSLPPIVNGMVVLADVPADAGFPIYTAVQSLVQNPITSDGMGGDYVLTTADGNTYTINSSTTLLPYLTRNIVREADLTPGTPILLWTYETGNPCPAKIVIFQGEEGNGAFFEVGEADGWKETSEGWYYYENGEKKTGWLLENGDWYYLSPETGLMRTGFVTVSGKTYFLNEDGRMLTKARVFTPDENGVLH